MFRTFQYLHFRSYLRFGTHTGFSQIYLCYCITMDNLTFLCNYAIGTFYRVKDTESNLLSNEISKINWPPKKVSSV